MKRFSFLLALVGGVLSGSAQGIIQFPTHPVVQPLLPLAETSFRDLTRHVAPDHSAGNQTYLRGPLLGGSLSGLPSFPVILPVVGFDPITEITILPVLPFRPGDEEIVTLDPAVVLNPILPGGRLIPLNPRVGGFRTPALQIASSRLLPDAAPEPGSYLLLGLGGLVLWLARRRRTPG